MKYHPAGCEIEDRASYQGLLDRNFYFGTVEREGSCTAIAGSRQHLPLVLPFWSEGSCKVVRWLLSYIKGGFRGRRYPWIGKVYEDPKPKRLPCPCPVGEIRVLKVRSVEMHELLHI